MSLKVIERFRKTFNPSLEDISKVEENTAIIVLGAHFIAPYALRLPPAKSVLYKRIVKFSENILAHPLRNLRQSISSKLPAIYTTYQYRLKQRVNWTSHFLGVVLEELTFRKLLQSVVLTKIPKFLLRKISPKKEHLVDHKISKVSRILFTASIFALAHMVRFGHYRGLLSLQFLSGIYYSYLHEQNYSLTKLSLIHFSSNAIFSIMHGGIGGK